MRPGVNVPSSPQSQTKLIATPTSFESREASESNSEAPSHDRMTIIQVTASRFYGGPERQMLELATALRDRFDTVFMSFSEGGLCRDFLDRAEALDFQTVELESDTPNVFAAAKELADRAKQFDAQAIFCEGYKPDIVGWLAKRNAALRGVPVASISRGWTKETWKVRVYEMLDRVALRYLDHVVCVSQEQANRVCAAGVPEQKTTVIRNAVRAARFDHGPSDAVRQSLLDLFPTPPKLLVGSAGRLSPEKGFEVFIDAAKRILQRLPEAGFLIFGDGSLRDELQEKIDRLQLGDRVKLAGFRDDLDHVIPNLDLFVLSSYTEGLPNVVLESLAASVPVVATAVGGTPEVLEHGRQGYVVPSGDAKSLAQSIAKLLEDEQLRSEMASAGRPHVDANFSFASQANAYARLVERLKNANHG